MCLDLKIIFVIERNSYLYAISSSLVSGLWRMNLLANNLTLICSRSGSMSDKRLEIWFHVYRQFSRVIFCCIFWNLNWLLCYYPSCWNLCVNCYNVNYFSAFIWNIISLKWPLMRPVINVIRTVNHWQLFNNGIIIIVLSINSTGILVGIPIIKNWVWFLLLLVILYYQVILSTKFVFGYILKCNYLF